MLMKRIFCLTACLVVLIQVAYAQLFYKIEGNGLKAPSYLFGTHHMAPLSVLDEYHVLEYIDSVGQVVGEIDLSKSMDVVQTAIMQYGMAPADSTLSKVISPEDFEVINEAFKKYSPMEGVDLRMLDGMRPAMISTIVTAQLLAESFPDFQEANMMDVYIQDRGTDKDKKIVGLETAEFQAKVLLGSEPISVQAANLVELLKTEPSEFRKEIEALNEAYFSGDLDKLMHLEAAENADPAFMNTFLTSRNRSWLNLLPAIMADEPALIAVGAMHLAGEDGLVAGLRDLGYTVTAISKK